MNQEEVEKKLWTQFLWGKMENIAKDQFGGHYTIFSFTSNYKGCFGTPSEHPLEFIPWLKPFTSIEALLIEMIKNPNDFISDDCPPNFMKKELNKQFDLYEQFEQEKMKS